MLPTWVTGTRPGARSRRTPGASWSATVGPLDWERLAITDEQAEREGLPPKPGTDRRYADDRPHVSYEAEALGQGRLTEILAVWLDALLPRPLAAVLEREEPQRERIAAVLRTLQ